MKLRRAALVKIARMRSEPSTTPAAVGSRRVLLAGAILASALAAGCHRGAPGGPEGGSEAGSGEQATESVEPGSDRPGAAGAAAGDRAASEPGSAHRVPPRAAPERSLGVTDRGVFSDLDDQVQITLPGDLPGEAISAVLDEERALLVLYRDSWPVKAYPAAGPAELAVGETSLSLRPGDRAELAGVLAPERLRVLGRGERPAPGDRDGDGIPDPLDLLVGGKKTVIDAAPYGGGYIRIDSPGGDIPRGMGVCTDVVIRAARNAGLDLQEEVQRDIRRAPRSYPMVKRPNAHIDHRRVKTILPYFLRHWDRRRAELDDPQDPLRPGDVVFMDTFPSRPGPDHIGIVSDTPGPSGKPLVINSWTDGFRTSEMDLLPGVPVTHRFRMPSVR